jgi:hypothetical protein
MPTMPNGLKPVVGGYQFDEPGGVMRTDVAGGAPRYAMDWDRGTQRFQVTLILDALQFSVWTAFYHWQIGKGSIAFTMQLDSGFGASPHQVNIMPGSYTAARTSGIMMVVSFVAEAESQVYSMTAAEAQAMLDFYALYGASSTAMLDRLSQFANQDTLVLQ